LEDLEVFLGVFLLAQ